MCFRKEAELHHAVPQTLPPRTSRADGDYGLVLLIIFSLRVVLEKPHYSLHTVGGKYEEKGKEKCADKNRFKNIEEIYSPEEEHYKGSGEQEHAGAEMGLKNQ